MAIIEVKFCIANVLQGATRTVQWDNVAHLVIGASIDLPLSGNKDDIAECQGPVLNVGDNAFQQVDGLDTYTLRVQLAYPFVEVIASTPNTCVNTIEGVNLVPSLPGSNNGQATIVVLNPESGLEYELAGQGGAPNRPLQASNVFDNLPPGTYTALIKKESGSLTCDNQDFTIVEDCSIDVQSTIVKQPTPTNLTGGQILVTALAPDPPATFELRKAGILQTSNTNGQFFNLDAGDYTVTITGNLSPCNVVLSFTLVAPDPITEYVDFPVLNPLRFVIDSTPLAQRSNAERLFGEMEVYGVNQIRNYDQKVTTNDIHDIQVLTSYTNNIIKVMRASDDQQQGADIALVKKSENLSNSREDNVKIEPFGTKRARVSYTGLQDLPEYAEVGLSVSITSPLLTGTFTVTDLSVSGPSGPFLLIALSNDLAAETTGTILSKFNVEDFEVYEAQIDWSNFAPGCYYVTIDGTAPGFGFTAYQARSEPVDLRTEHQGTVLLEYYEEMDFIHGMDFGYGIRPRIRVEADFYIPSPDSDEAHIIDSQRVVNKVKSLQFSRREFRSFDLPLWLHEKLYIIFGTNRLSVDSVLYSNNGEKYSVEATPHLRGEGSIILQQSAFLTNRSVQTLVEVDDEILVAGEDSQSSILIDDTNSIKAE